MGIFSDLFSSRRKRADPKDRERVLNHWGLDGTRKPNAADSEPTDYDRLNWRKKLQRILEDLPGSQKEWSNFLPDAQALKLGEDWIRNTLREEFTLLVRRAVADHVVTDAEHHKLDLAHQLIGLSDADAAKIFQQVVAEAEEFFGTDVQGV